MNEYIGNNGLAPLSLIHGVKAALLTCCQWLLLAIAKYFETIRTVDN